MQHGIELLHKIQTYAKAIVATVGSFLVAAVSFGDDFGVSIISDEAQKAVAFILVVLTAFSTWAIPNYEVETEE
jgi:uncharacterized membrane protein